MADDYSSDENCDSYVLYRDRKEWKDVTPIPQDDGPYSVVQIAYSEKFKDVYDYLRAVLKADEKSDRAFELTKDACRLNSANYTVWHYRRVIIKALNKDIREELRYIGDMIRDHPKNYQVWHHRKCIVEWLHDATGELEFVAEILDDDAKNYHAWQHRQWMLKEFKLWEGELDYVHRLLGEDLRNNSAWNQRFYVIYSTTGYTEQVTREESRYAMDFIAKAPNNESPWNYLRGVLLERTLRDFPEVWEFCEELYSKDIRSPHLLGFMIDCIEEQLEDPDAQGDKAAMLTRATEMCSQLADSLDTIRVEYWRYVSRSLLSRFGSVLQAAGDS